MPSLRRTIRNFFHAKPAPSRPSGRAHATGIDPGQVQETFARLNRLKARRTPERGVDYLRALCFLEQQQPIAAIEALKEELRYFPDHSEASALLEQLLAENLPAPAADDPEFQELFQVIRPYTMLGEARLRSLFRQAKRVCRQEIPGHFAECGVAAGGSAALLAAVIRRYSHVPRRLFAFDTFGGMPDPSAHDIHGGQPADASGWGSGTCAAPEASLAEVCRKLGVETMVEPVKGLFADTLPRHRERLGPIAFLHMDGDWYASTREILEQLYDPVSPGGCIQIDDYGYWDGCRKAVHEFERKRGLRFELQPIDDTGVWLTKSPIPAPAGTLQPEAELLNLGCGHRFHPDWVNVDCAPADPAVLPHDLQHPLPFANESFRAVYHSHVLEHLPRAAVPRFLKECHRVLKPGGLLRVVVPDLETIARWYLKCLEGALAGDPEAARRYEWITLELMDQMVREHSGGAMLEYWKQNPMPAEDFVFQRLGPEVRRAVDRLRQTGDTAAAPARNPSASLSPLEVGQFRQSGEVHRWMYDRYSLGVLLQAAGFVAIRACAAHESAIPGFDRYRLDVDEAGAVRKPDSLFMEARKP